MATCACSNNYHSLTCKYEKINDKTICIGECHIENDCSLCSEKCCTQCGFCPVCCNRYKFTSYKSPNCDKGNYRCIISCIDCENSRNIIRGNYISNYDTFQHLLKIHKALKGKEQYLLDLFRKYEITPIVEKMDFRFTGGKDVLSFHQFGYLIQEAVCNVQISRELLSLKIVKEEWLPSEIVILAKSIKLKKVEIEK